MKIRKNNGITLLALGITIIVIIIITSITLYAGTDIFKKAGLGEVKTNMLLIQAKAKENVEEVNFRLGPNQQKIGEIETIRTEIYGEEGLQKASTVANLQIPSEITIDDTLYLVTQDTLSKWGLDKIKLLTNENYLIKFDEINCKVEVYNTIGYDGKYSLTEVDQIEL